MLVRDFPGWMTRLGRWGFIRLGPDLACGTYTLSWGAGPINDAAPNLFPWRVYRSVTILTWEEWVDNGWWAFSPILFMRRPNRPTLTAGQYGSWLWTGREPPICWCRIGWGLKRRLYSWG